MGSVISVEMVNSFSKLGLKSQSLCEICAETKSNVDMFPFEKCSHSFCTDCISMYISTTIKERRTIVLEKKGVITCPGVDCTIVLEIESCRDLLAEDVISLWDDVLCESIISSSRKVYCPYKNCSAWMVRESDDEEMIREAECPFCNRLFCVNCNVPWHSGVDCEEFSRLKKDEREKEDLMLHNLAKKMMWKRCPNCNFYVEKSQGCLHMTCRCGSHFCYACGKAWTQIHRC